MAGNSEQTGKKRGPGRPFQPGQSGNPNGRPKVVEELRQRALKAVEEHVLAAWVAEVEGVEIQAEDNDGNPRVDDKGEPVMVRYRGKDWIKASELLAAYGMGKPVQAMEHTGKDGGPIQAEHRADVHIYLPDNGRSDAKGEE